jgi:hypothetical protein
MEGDAVLPDRFDTKVRSNVLPSTSLLFPEDEGSTLQRNGDIYWQKWRLNYQKTAIGTVMGVIILK